MITEEQKLLQLPPQAIEAEQSILGSMMLNPIAIEDVTEVLLATDFYRHDHQTIFETILSIFSDNQPCDVVTVSEKLTSLGLTDQVGGLAYLGSLAKNTPNRTNHKAYARIVRETSMKRQLIEVCNEHAEKVYAGGQSPQELSNSLSIAVEKIDSVNSNSFGLTLSQVAPTAMDALQTRFESKSHLIGLSTGLTDLDQMTAGLCPGDLIVIGARPSMGKTAFAQCLAKKCLEDGGIVQSFSMEMPAVQIYDRIWAEQSGVPLGLIRQPKGLEPDQWSRLTQSMAITKDWNLVIDDQSGLNINQIRARSRKTKRRFGGLGMVMIDYLQLMQLSGEGNKADQIGEVTRQLKSMAKDLQCPVVLLSQLNRSLEQRPNKRPVMSDLRDSGSIEADADIIAFLYRDEQYNQDTEWKGVCEIAIAKQRNGPTGKVMSQFQGELQRFSDLSQAYGRNN